MKSRSLKKCLHSIFFSPFHLFFSSLLPPYCKLTQFWDRPAVSMPHTHAHTHTHTHQGLQTGSLCAASSALCQRALFGGGTCGLNNTSRQELASAATPCGSSSRDTMTRTPPGRGMNLFCFFFSFLKYIYYSCTKAAEHSRRKRSYI